MGTFLTVLLRKSGNSLWTLVAWVTATLIAITSYRWLFRPAINDEWAFGTTFWCVARTVLFVGMLAILFIAFSCIIAVWKKKAPVAFYILLILLFWIVSHYFLFPTVFHWLSPTYY